MKHNSYLLAIWIFCLVKCPFKYFAKFSIKLSFSYCFFVILFVINIKSFADVMHCKDLFLFCGIFLDENTLNFNKLKFTNFSFTVTHCGNFISCTRNPSLPQNHGDTPLYYLLKLFLILLFTFRSIIFPKLINFV